MNASRRTSAKAIPTVKRVTTYRRESGQVVQRHHGYYGAALVEGDGTKGQGTRCGHFHQKAKAARECAERLARKIAKDLG